MSVEMKSGETVVRGEGEDRIYFDKRIETIVFRLGDVVRQAWLYTEGAFSPEDELKPWEVVDRGEGLITFEFARRVYEAGRSQPFLHRVDLMVLGVAEHV